MGYEGQKSQDTGMFFCPFIPLKDNDMTTVNNFVPDPKKHLVVSLVKSGIRIAGYLLLLGIPSGWAVAAAIVLVASEVVGIVEELV